MVFESIVVDILNRVLGSYFENLNTSQLKLGIWGGDVVLRELLLKTSAMDDLGLPFKVVVGKVGSLTMKIPWQSLYTNPVELSLQNLVLLVTPSQAVKYNEESEEKAKQSAKERELARLDEIREKEKLKRQQREHGAEVQKEEDTFTEKLVTNIIKNVQIKIDCIHIRYEDDVTRPQSPFACGVILKSLRVETTDEDWKPKIITEMVETVNKLATLEGLAIYWNSDTRLLHKQLRKSELMDELRKLVLGDKDKPHLTYVLSPIMSTAKLLLTPNPERGDKPFTKPKFKIDLLMEELGLGMNNLQFGDIIQFVESLDFMTRSQQYRKFRPDIKKKGNAKEWWKFAFTCILEEDIRRSRQNWDWHHIKRHRDLCHIYADSYYKKLTEKKLKPEVTYNLQKCEKDLDLFNLALIRRKTELRVESEGKKKEEERKGQGWFSGWWGGWSSEAPKEEDPTSMAAIAKRMESALTPDEKKKLYEAIDYSQDAGPLEFPNDYIDLKLKFRLNKVTLTIRDVLTREIRDHKIIKMVVDTVETRVTTRPVGNGLHVGVIMKSFEVEGSKARHDVNSIKMVTSKTHSESANLLEVTFENNPLFGQGNQKIRVKAQPIEIIYHGHTIIHLVKCFSLPPEVKLSRIQVSAFSAYTKWKASTATGLAHLIETRGEIDLQVDLLAPYIIIPQGGVLPTATSSCLVVDLGELRMKSRPRDKANTQEMVEALKGVDEGNKEFYDKMMKWAYDMILIELKDFQVVMALPGEESLTGILKSKFISKNRDHEIYDETDTIRHTPDLPGTLIKSSRLVFELGQSLIPDDPRFPKLQLEASLPVLSLNLSDHRIIELLSLLVTLPLPQSDVPEKGEADLDRFLPSISEHPEVQESVALTKLAYEPLPMESGGENQKKAVEFVELRIRFLLEQFKIEVTRTASSKSPKVRFGNTSPVDASSSRQSPAEVFITFELNQFRFKLTNKTFSSAMDLAMGELSVKAPQHKMMDGSKEKAVFLIKTAKNVKKEDALFKMHLSSNNPDSPIQSNIKQKIRMNLSSMDLVLHKEALQDVMIFVDELLKAIQPPETTTIKANVETASTSSMISASSSSSKAEAKKLKINRQLQAKMKQAKKRRDVNLEEVLMQIDGNLDALTVQISTTKKSLIRLNFKRFSIDLAQKVGTMAIKMELQGLAIRYLNSNFLYQHMMRFDTERVVSIKVITHENATKGKYYYDMDKHDIYLKVETGSPKIFYIASQIDELLDFANAFGGAKEAVVEASSAAAIAAKENVEQNYTSSTRVVLDIELNAPIIFVPRNEKSEQCALADLGKLLIKNKFVIESVKDKKQHATAILDKMDIMLTNMKLSRIYFSKILQDMQSEVLMMEPLTFGVSVTRNLSNEWYHGVPDLAVDGTLKSVSIKASNEDYDLLMSILSENIGAKRETPAADRENPTKQLLSTPSRPATPAPSSPVPKRRKSSITHRPVSAGTTSDLQTIVSTRPEEIEPYNQLAVALHIPVLKVVMYQKGAVKLESHQGVVPRDKDTAFADFAITGVKMDMTQLNNGNMTCPITVDDITLRDVRPGDRVITNLIQKKASSALTSHVAKFSFKTDAANKKGAMMTLETTSLTLVVCLDYLLQIADFFSRSESEAEEKKPDLPVRGEVFDDGPKGVREALPELPKVQIGLDEDEDRQPFSAFFNFAETELILVESMESRSSNAIMLHCEVVMKQQELNGRSNMMGTIGNLVLSTCAIDQEDRHTPVAEVISPTSVTLVMNNSEAMGTLIDINISDIFIRMTAGTLELLLKIVSTLSPSGSETSKMELKDYSDIWEIRTNEEMNFWFLNPDAAVEVGLEALDLQEDKVKLFSLVDDVKVNERLVLESGCIVFTFETGIGNNTMPMFLLETDIDLQMFDWSANMTMAGRMKVEAAYYNTTYGGWEYFIEPVETRHHGKVAHQPWELLFEFSNRSSSSAAGTPSSEDDDPRRQAIAQSNSYMSLALESSSILELSVTKTALDVIDILKDDFNAATKQLVSEKAISTAAYTIQNDTGSDVRILVKEKGKSPCFVLVRAGVDYEEVVLKHGTSVNLGLIESADLTKHHSSVLREQEGKEERLLVIEIQEFSFKKEIPVNRACKRYYNIRRQDGHGNFGMICDIWVKDCSKIVTLRSVVQIVNDLPIEVDIYYKEDHGKVAKLSGTAEAGQKFNVPIPHTLTKCGELFFAPAGYRISNSAFSWTQTIQELEMITQVQSTKKPGEGEGTYYVKIIGEAKQALHESTNRKNLASQCAYIYLEPPLVINNLLPCQVGYYCGNEFIVAEKGLSVCVTNIHVGLDGKCKLEFKIPEYAGSAWKCLVTIDSDTQEISQWTFTSVSNPSLVQTIGIHKEIIDNEVILHLYCPYWMINRTGLSLIYKGDDKTSHQTDHSHDWDGPVMFSFPGKAFFSKKAGFVKVKEHPERKNSPSSDWSEKFSLDVAGSGGSISCKSPHHQYQIGVEIQLSSWGLTKYVFFTPRFYLVNQCPFPVLVKEEEIDSINGHHHKGVMVVPTACIPFWPEGNLPHVFGVVEDPDTGEAFRTKSFAYDTPSTTLLDLRGLRYGGLHVDIHYSEAKTVVTFNEYVQGQAPALIINATNDCPIQIMEDGVDGSDDVLLMPNYTQLYTWKEPKGQRAVKWSAFVVADRDREKDKTVKAQGSDRLLADGFGTFSVEGTPYYWISFLDGTQRVLLFTKEVELMKYLQAARESEVATAEYIVMLSGIGISLVDNDKLRELLYMRIASSEINWETCKPAKKKRYKPLPQETSNRIEMAYQNYLNQKSIQTNVKPLIQLDSGIEVDFSSMMLRKPNPKHLRRVFQTGIWLHYKTLPTSTQFHAKIYRLQIDNQMQDAIFRVIFAPVPPPKSIVTSDIAKPFAEVSVMQRINAHSYLQQFKYFKILVQEFHVQLDLAFINAMIDMFSGSSASRQENMMAKYTSEYTEACLKLEEVLARQIVSQGQKHFFDFLHLSPLKMHVSFSMGGAGQQVSNHFLSLILASVGVTLTEIQDVVFKLSCLELQHTFLSGDQLYAEVYSHYSSQAIKQLYVLVLGLDVLGNPYGLATGIASGVQAFFYEPIQGAIQGPGEFAEGLALGVKKLLGSTVGGAAGAFSKITGTLGKGIAALTLDDEYQRKRREQLHHRGDAAEGLARSGKGLVMGFVDGITGVVTQPIRGAKEDKSVGGFFKGMGKGAIGLVVRPAAGIVDFASGSFDAVKKCASSTVEVSRMRPPRCIAPDAMLQPYVKHEAEGVQLLNDIEKGRYAKTDSYIAHALINPHGIYVVLLTNKRLMYLKRDEMFGGWGVEWTYLWEDFSHPPDLVEKGILFTLKTAPKKKCKMFGSSASKEFVVPIYSAQVCTWLLSKIEEAMKTETGMVFTDGVEATELSFV